ncbi:MAG: hypothetical protein O3B85_15590 [Planctomycetota bacterium]|nr:hypothetical protein [Planctomycetota bacterium]
MERQRVPDRAVDPVDPAGVAAVDASGEQVFAVRTRQPDREIHDGAVRPFDEHPGAGDVETRLLQDPLVDLRRLERHQEPRRVERDAQAVEDRGRREVPDRLDHAPGASPVPGELDPQRFRVRTDHDPRRVQHRAPAEHRLGQRAGVIGLHAGRVRHVEQIAEPTEDREAQETAAPTHQVRLRIQSTNSPSPSSSPGTE